MAAARALVVLAIAAGIVAIAPGNAWACSCRTSSVAEQVKDAGTVVDGSLEWVATNGLETTYSVKVADVFKGRAAEREKLVGPASEAACGLGSLVADQRYLFFIDGQHPGRMKVSSCGGSAAYDARTAAQVEAITGRPTGPSVAPQVSGAVDQTPIEGTHWYTVVGTTVVIAVVLAGLLFVARRPRRR